MTTEDKKTTIADYPSYRDNPFILEGIEYENVKYKDGKRIVDEDGVESIIFELGVEKVIIDKRKYVKIFNDSFTTIKDLSTCGLQLLCFMALRLAISKDEIYLDIKAFNEFCDYKSRQPFYKGIVELLNKGVIARKVGKDHFYFINTNFIFNGSRKKLYKQKEDGK